MDSVKWVITVSSPEPVVCTNTNWLPAPLLRKAIYPSTTFEKAYDTNTPEVFAVIVAVTFAVVIVVFFTYDLFVEKRNNKLINKAARSGAIVSSLFPKNIRDRLIGQGTDADYALLNASKNLRSFMTTDGIGTSAKTQYQSKPLADIFLDTTVLFAGTLKMQRSSLFLVLFSHQPTLEIRH